MFFFLFLFQPVYSIVVCMHVCVCYSNSFAIFKRHKELRNCAFICILGQMLPLDVYIKRENLKCDRADIVLIHTFYVVLENVVLIYRGFYILTTLGRSFVIVLMWLSV